MDFGNQRFSAGAEYISVKDYFLAQGYADYVAIDVNDKFGSLVMDLSRPLAETYGYRETFDLVINNGTGEHIFNQFEVYRNAHRLCAVNGLMLHIMPFIGFLNHGFFSFHPLLYLDLASANGYLVEALGIGERWGEHRWLRGGFSPDGYAQVTKLDRSIHMKRAWSWRRSALEQAIRTVEAASRRHNNATVGNVMVIAVLRKRTDADFVAPFQGKYINDIDTEVVTDYDRQKKAEPEVLLFTVYDTLPPSAAAVGMSHDYVITPCGGRYEASACGHDVMYGERVTQLGEHGTLERAFAACDAFERKGIEA